MKNPSIHITKTNFKLALKASNIFLSDEKIECVFVECYKKRVVGRNLIYTSKKVKADKILRGLKDQDVHVDLFLKILNLVRVSHKHKFISNITPNMTNYNNLKSICKIADDFCRSYEMPKSEGYKYFCNIGLGIMGKTYALNKFKFNSEKIFTLFEWTKLLDNDSTQEMTVKVLETYISELKSRGVDFKIDTLEERIHFLYAKNEIVEHSANISAWVSAQFAGLEFVDAYPTSHQLHGEGALKRYKQQQISNMASKKSEDPFNYSDFFAPRDEKG